ncbi:hypothetical protein EVAR_24925_1 [Eumeta japonica]|uniref:Uncharacterized protein n=1 Tax=Eumeta variegata TaxID=151549 RepID=A0A4C1V5F4_EUMVA|nr:hypothetical protein EVAR_24925_1 [Eumeta japonica]
MAAVLQAGFEILEHPPYSLGPYKVMVWNLTTCPGPTGTGDLDMYLVEESPEIVHFIIEGNIKNRIGPIGNSRRSSRQANTTNRKYILNFTLSHIGFDGSQTKIIGRWVRIKLGLNSWERMENRRVVLQKLFDSATSELITSETWSRDKGDLKWSVLGKKGYTTVFSFQSKKICESLKTKEIRATSLIPNVDNRCFLLKGPYRQEISDVNAAMHAFLGTTVPYGKYLVKVNITAGRKLLICKYYRFETVPFSK